MVCTKILSVENQKLKNLNSYIAGKSIVVGHRDGTIRVISLKDNIVTATIPINEGHTDLVTSIDCHINNKLFISVSTDGKTMLSTSHNGKVKKIILDIYVNH